MAVLQEFDFDLPEIKESLFLQKDKILRMGNAPIRIELLTTISGVDFQPCHMARIEDSRIEDSRIEDSIDGTKIKIIDLENLKKNKKASGRFKDLDDLENLP